MVLDANHHDLYMTNVDDLVINNIVGADNSYHVVTDLQYDQYTFATDLSISSDGQGGISWSYTNVTMDVATGADTENFETDKGLFTATW